MGEGRIEISTHKCFSWRLVYALGRRLTGGGSLVFVLDYSVLPVYFSTWQCMPPEPKVKDGTDTTSKPS